MNRYFIKFKPNCGLDYDKAVVDAHRVEGWSQDYAFFGHSTYLKEVTLLLPRELVEFVSLERDMVGNKDYGFVDFITNQGE